MVATFYKYIATNVRIAITAIAYYNNVMYKVKKLATYLCYIYVAITINVSSYTATCKYVAIYVAIYDYIAMYSYSYIYSVATYINYVHDLEQR